MTSPSKDGKGKRAVGRPDEVHQVGPIRLARYGRVVVMENQMTAGEHKRLLNEHARMYPDICKRIHTLVGDIRATVSKLAPLELMQRAFWEVVSGLVGLEKESEVTTTHAVDQRMLDYVQAIIVGTPQATEDRLDLTDEVWTGFRSKVEKLYSLLNLDYHLARSARLRVAGSVNAQVEEIYVHAQLLWCSVRGKRYQVHQMRHLRELLLPHDVEFRKLFRISAEDLLSELTRIEQSLTAGPLQAARDLSLLHRQWARGVDPKDFEARAQATSVEEALRESLGKSGIHAELDAALGRFLGLDLFRLSTALPRALLEEMSLRPGQDSSLFAEGEFRGWPLRLLPTWNRPFLKVGEAYYCFDYYTLFDHLVRTLQRIVCRLDPAYARTWNETQTTVTEDLPFQWLATLLPHATVYRNVHYQWTHPRTGRIAWAECDGLVLLDDLLIAVEVKAGAFAYTSPATDLEAYLTATKDVLFAPITQGRRFLRELTAAGEVRLYRRPRRRPLDDDLIGVVRAADFQQRHICAVTLDQLTDIASSIQHRGVGPDALEGPPAWLLSLDDLRVYADLFRNPLVFCHFLEQRQKAFSCPHLQTDDELDHIGLYFQENLYGQVAQERGATVDRITWAGYRDEIDKYYYLLLASHEEAVMPKQEMPSLYASMLDVMSAQRKPGRRRAASYVLDADSPTRAGLALEITHAVEQQATTGQVKPISTYGGYRLTMFCRHSSLASGGSPDPVLHTLACMARPQEEDRLLLLLTFDREKRLVDVECRLLSRADWESDPSGRIALLAENLVRARYRNARLLGQVLDPASSCLCGSGRALSECCHDLAND